MPLFFEKSSEKEKKVENFQRIMELFGIRSAEIFPGMFPKYLLFSLFHKGFCRVVKLFG